MSKTASLEFSVLQWNVWFKEDPDNIVRLLREQSPDIACLQELIINDRINTPQYIAEQLGYYCCFKEIPIESSDGEKVVFANGIFSRFPIQHERWSWINEPQIGGGYSDEYRAYVEATLDMEGRAVTVGTTHSSYTHKFQSTPAKEAETDRLVTEIARHKARYIFTSDLNASPKSYTIHSIEKHLQNAGPAAAENTWTTKPFSYNGFHENALRWRLDYVFATPDLFVHSAEVVPTEFSDHLPLLVRFRSS
ncbi:MAG TPA: endonuclease/exonuclease/phosphatase family protein [Candidatus Saccharimonadales bacterium]|nr:endonuclease/exonuclease/phosphatase family protein [Candidatus Saccharimonadales bacterium]